MVEYCTVIRLIIKKLITCLVTNIFSYFKVLFFFQSNHYDEAFEDMRVSLQYLYSVKKTSQPFLYVNPSSGMQLRTNQEKPGLQISCFLTHVEFVYRVIA